MDKRFSPPSHLSPRAKTLWSELVPSRCRSIGRLTLLQSALESLDLSDRARIELAKLNLTTVTKTTAAVHVHPLVKVEREARQQFARIWADLGLGSDIEDRMPFEHWLANHADDELRAELGGE